MTKPRPMSKPHLLTGGTIILPAVFNLKSKCGAPSLFKAQDESVIPAALPWLTATQNEEIDIKVSTETVTLI